jgi:two-component system sensor histidine kinase BaeS
MSGRIRTIKPELLDDERTATLSDAAFRLFIGLILLADTSPARVTGDADRLHQIAVNLIANAIKFTPTRGTVTVRTRRLAGSATIEVSDTGPGIPPDDLPHVFERFWRGANGAKAPGSGIGLAVVQELTAAHHGTVTVSSESGEGARFVVTLPLA